MAQTKSGGQPMKRTAVVIAGVAGSGAAALGQVVVGQPLCLSCECPDVGAHSREVAIAVSPVTPTRLLAAWNRVGPLGDAFVWYALSTDGGSSWTCPAPLPTPSVA